MSRRTVLRLAALSALGSLGIHAFVPALPSVSEDLGAPAGLIQLGISLYMVGLVLGQLVGGWSSDLVGRRQVLIAGGLLYIGGAGVCAIAPDILAFLIGRTVQGIGGACSLVVARAVVADISEGAETAVHLTRLALIALLAPTLAPMLGGLLVAIGGWRLIFVVLGLLGAASLAAVLLGLAESGTRAVGRSPWAPFSRLISNWMFMRFATMNAIATIGMFGFLAAAPFLLSDLYDVGPAGTGVALLLIALFVMLGTLCSGRFERIASGLGLELGALIFASGGASMLCLAFVIDDRAALILPMMASGFGAGLMGPSALAGALHSAPEFRGTASSLFGALQMAVGAATTALVGAFYEPSLFAAAIPLAAAGALLVPLARYRAREL